MCAELAHSESDFIELFVSENYLAVGSIRENRVFFDSGKGPKTAALSISEKKRPHWNRD